MLDGALSSEALEVPGTYAVHFGTLRACPTRPSSDLEISFTTSIQTLTVIADAGQSKEYGAADPVLTYTAMGFENGDDASMLSGALSRAAGEDTGTYAIQLGTLSAGANYTINFVGADF